MPRYHVNPVSGNPGLCKAVYTCPFGDKETAHFDTPEGASRFFEQTQDSFAPPKKKRGSVYRIGSLTPATLHFADLEQMIRKMDEARPEGRQGRAGALFASPDMDSHMRWVKGANLGRRGKVTDSHELYVDPNNTYVYPIDVYEEASLAESNGRLEEFEKLRKEYWDSGMTLVEWRRWSEKAKPDAGTWEVLLPAESIQSSRIMSSRRIIEAAPENMAKEINWILEPRRAAKGLIWRKTKEESSE